MQQRHNIYQKIESMSPGATTLEIISEKPILGMPLNMTRRLSNITALTLNLGFLSELTCDFASLTQLRKLNLDNNAFCTVRRFYFGNLTYF